MRHLKSALLIGALAAAIMTISPASATPLGSTMGKGVTAPAADSLVIEVQGGQRRARQGGGGGQRVGRGGGGGRAGGGSGGRGVGTGLAIGLGLGVVGAAIAADQYRRQDAVHTA
jgi:hypothetical protein